MPIEREFKYLLSNPLELYEFLDNSDQIKHKIAIHQIYLPKSGRFRSRTFWKKDGKLIKKPVTQYQFAYKCPLTQQKGCLEIETDVSQSDFELAKNEATDALHKTRFVIKCPTAQGVWEVDFFKKDNEIYLVMAEYEVKEGEERPVKIHPLLEKYCILEAEEDDSRFNNKKLANITYVKDLLREMES